MTRRGALGVGLGWAVAWSGAADQARAQPATTQPVHLVLAPTDCTSDVAFWDRVTQRAPHLRRAAEGEAAPRLEIRIAREAGAGHVVGTMRVVSPGAEPSTRTVTGSGCGEMVDALSVMAAIAFAAPDREPAPPAVAPAPAPAPEPSASAEPSAPSPPPSARWRLTAGVSGGGASMGGLALAAGGFIDAAREPYAGGASGWLPSVRLAASVASFDRSVGPADASIVWRVLALDGCPWRGALGERWTLRPCASVEGGALRVMASGVQSARAETRPWISVGARLRLAWIPVDPIAVGVDAGALVPLLRDEFAVDPSLLLFQAPEVVLSGGVTLGVRFL